MRWLVIAIGLGVLVSAIGESPPRTERVPGVAASRAHSDVLIVFDSASHLFSAEAHIAAREYWASPARDGLQAPNRRHDLRSWFEPTGLRVHERSTHGTPKLVELRWTALGRGERILPVAAGEVSHAENRVENRREGLVEWYDNSEQGLEHGFTLNERPEADVTGDLVLELSVAGARASLRGDGVALSTGAGRTLSYSKLAVFDGNGLALAAHFELPAPDRVRIVVDDRVATYPILIDPLLAETPDTLLVADSFGSLGRSVASAGDLNGDGFDDLIVGAPFFDAGESAEGAAFVFLGSAAGIADGGPATAHAQIEGDQVSAEMGSSVASAGDVNGDGYDDVIIGAARYDAGEVDEGAAFIFLGSGTGLADGTPATAHAQLEGDQPNASFGASVASAGDVNGDGFGDVIVGASRYDAGEVDEGAAFVFLGSAAGIADGGPATAHAQLESDQVGGGFFRAPALGGSVASAGDVNGDGYSDVIVGANGYDAGQIDEGAAFIFLGSAAGIASGNAATAHARLESNEDLALLGSSVAWAGDVNGDGYGDVIVGAPLYGADQPEEGAAFVFLGSATGIASGDASTAHAQFESNQEKGVFNIVGSDFGRSVAAAGDVNGDGYGDVIVGSPTYPVEGSGAAFVFLGSAAGIPDGNPSTAYAELVLGGQPSGFANGVNIGISVAGSDLNGDGFGDVIVGVPGYVPNEGVAVGAALVYMGASPGMANGDPSTADGAIVSDQASSALGFAVASAGDVNGDGFGDVIVGAPYYDMGEVGEGAAFVFLGSAMGLSAGSPTTAHAQLESDQEGAALGWAVASAGDVNGDGFGDVIVSAPGYDAGEYNEGAAFVFLGSATGIADGNPANAHARIEGDQEHVEFDSMGFAILAGIRSVSSAGDVNGDGFGDVIVGSSGYDLGQTNEGAAFVFLGSATGIAGGNPSTAHARLESDQENGGMGFSVASAGDVNGDGFSDLVVGAPAYNLPSGAAFVFLGSAAGIPDGSPATAHQRLDSIGSLVMGYSVASAGDVDGDGYDDVIVGDPGHTRVAAVLEGAAFVFLGSAAGIADGNPHARFDALQQFDPTIPQPWLGAAVASAGDVNGDGFGDVIVGAPGSGGGAFVFLGSSAGMVDGYMATAHAQIQSIGGATAATNVASAGDVNGDGFGDVMVGSPHYVGAQSSGGGAFVFLGNAGGRLVRTQQRRGDGSGLPVEPGGAAYAEDGFEAELVATSPRGRERAKLEVEVCSSGVAFGSPGCATHQSVDWSDLGTSGASLSATIIGLTPDTAYSWRARALYAAFSATQPGVTPTTRPGIWRRLQGQAQTGDVRTVVPEPTIGLGLLFGLVLLAGRTARAASRTRKLGR